MAATNEFQHFLQSELQRRSQLNSSYSIRAFARHLQVDPSFLAKILNGKRRVTSKTVLRFGTKLGLDPQKTAAFIAPKKNSKETEIFSPVAVDQFHFIADWQHFAILEILQSDNFQPSITNLAKSLKIPHGVALASVERLQRLGLLQITSEGKWVINGNNTTTTHPFTTAAFQQLQKQILQQAIQAMDDTPLAERDQSSITMCIAEDKIPEAKEKIKKFRRELMQFLESGKPRGRVYQLSISLFPVSKKMEAK